MAEDKEEKATGKLRDKLDAYQEKQKGLLRINDVDLNEDFVNQAANYFSAAEKFRKAEQVLGVEKLRLEEIKSDIYLEHKTGETKTTEAHLDKLCKNDPLVIKQQKRVIMAEYQVGVHQAVMRGWEHKRDMLIQVGAVQRAEMAGQVSLNKNHANHEDVSHSKGGRPRSL